MGMLAGLPYPSQADIMARFAPKAGTRDVKGLFMGFVRSVSGPLPAAAAYGPGKGAGGKIAQVPVARVPTATGGLNQGFAGSAFEPEVEEFLALWGLDDESAEAMAAHSYDVQMDVVSKFAPKGKTQNIKSLFMGFLRSRASGPRNIS